eukprot:g4200.t1
MDEALQLHNACLRQILRQNRGHESATEGDVFILAFHTAIDAVRFCIEAQLALSEVQWPDAIIQSTVSPLVALNEHTNNLRTVIDRFSNGYQLDKNTSTQDLSPDSTGFTIDNNAVFWETAETQQSTEGATRVLPSLRFLFKGLRVRMAVYTGIEESSDVIMNNTSGRIMYTGMNMTLTKAISEVGHGGQFYEIIPKQLVGRLLHFPALKAKSLSPAWHQAPSGTVCLSFSFIVGAETLSQWNGGIFRESLAIYESIAKERLSRFNGYQVKAADGLLLVAFSDPAAAIAWALTFHERLNEAPWPTELLKHPLCEKLSVHSIDDSRFVHLKESNGFRLKTWIEQGPANSTPLMAYRGKVINRSARITKFANERQIYALTAVWETARNSLLMAELAVR